MNRAIFLDRDGVICKETNLFYKGHPITKLEHFEWEEISKEALQKLSSLDFLLVMITNQAQINRGLLTAEGLQEINKPIYDELRKYGRSLDGFYFCPHRPEENCGCRKPKLGLVKKAQQELSLDLNNSWFCGDTTSDIKTGKDAGCKTILVQTGYSGRDGQFEVSLIFIVKDLMDAYNLIQDEYRK